jgi:lipopolysaccharide transport protein LptA
LSNPAADRRFRLSQYSSSRTAAVFAAVGAFALWVGINCNPLCAQTLTPTPAGNRFPTQKKVKEKAEKTARGKTDGTHVTDRRDKPAPGGSKNQDSQTPFGSFTNSNRGPISIQSDSLALDYKENAVLFNGHVHATQADGALTSNTLNVKYGKDFHEVQDMAADGNVHISQGVRWCTSDHAVMNQRQHTVILTGSPICRDASDQIAGTRITVHLDTGKSDVEAAKAVIFPQQSKTRDNEALADKTK